LAVGVVSVIFAAAVTQASHLFRFLLVRPWVALLLAAPIAMASCARSGARRCITPWHETF
jgi:hypothetical protein